MAINTGEDEQGLRKIMDMTRMISVGLLLLHSYYFFYQVFQTWHLTAPIGERLLLNIAHTGLFNSFQKAKVIALAFLTLSLMGARGKKGERYNYRSATIYLVLGLVFYFGSCLVLLVGGIPPEPMTVTYMAGTGLGYILVMAGGAMLTRVIRDRLRPEVFNTDNETFPQEERLLVNEYSINLPAEYQLRGKTRRSWLNIINGRRGILLMGSPGSGKSWFIIENIIRQLIEKRFCLFIYDFKYPELSTLAYNHYLKHRKAYKVPPTFYCVNFRDAAASNRCNPLHPSLLEDILDAMEASKTILLSINRTWANKQGDFWVESPINFLAAVFWFLRKYQDGAYCTLPHAIELIQLPYDKLFTMLNTEPEVQTLVGPFLSGYLNDNMETVDSQMASVRIPLARLASPQLYYILSGNDFTLDINNPVAPKIVCLGNDPVKSEALAPVISLFCDRMNKVINQKGKAKCSTIYDEFGTIRVSSIQTVIATGRSNDIIPVIALQDFSQLKKVYSKEEAETIFNMTGNIISGQVSGETAKMLSERFPKTMQDRESLSINSSDISISKSKQLEASIPPSTIASLSSGEFIGLVADNPDQPITLKAIHAKVINDTAKINRERAAYLPLPHGLGMDKHLAIQENYRCIKHDIKNIVEAVMEELLNDPEIEHLVIKK